MAEEKKEEIKKPVPEAAQKPAEQTQPAAPASEPKAEVKAAAEPAKAPEAKKKEDTATEKPANCTSCNKSIKNKRWYYRNGKYYCSKRCWQTAAKKEKAPAQSQEATPQK